jgi:hypothetical protein
MFSEVKEVTAKCTTVKSFKWEHIDDEKFFLKTPSRCHKCERIQNCMEKSWVENDRDSEEFKASTIIVNLPEAKHVDVNPTEIKEAQED